MAGCGCCAACPSPDTDPVNITLDGVVLCPGFVGDINGTFAMHPFGGSNWSGLGPIIHRTGFPDLQIEIFFFCPSGGSGLFIQVTDTDFAFNYFEGSGSMPGPITNIQTSCGGGDEGTGGTATMSF